jgi:pyruvate,orthophosphate dikinase
LFRYAAVLSWADKFRTLQVLANADTPEDVATARDNGAEGIGLVRTEHMFFGTPERIKAVRRLVLADSESSRKAALDELLPYQRDDFTGIFKAMSGLSVTVRLLDPPLHEFLPPPDEMDAAVEEIAGYTGMSKESVLERARALREINPMLGLRGCRLGITFPEVTRMQIRAIFEAAIAVQEQASQGLVTVLPQIMIPLVGSVAEYEHQNAVIREVAQQVFKEHKCALDFEVGVMIEVPRATLVAKQLVAAGAEFFSFGTNDLTQMTLGFSRDDVVGLYNLNGVQPWLASAWFQRTLDPRK